MFRWGIIFLVIALIAAALGFGGLAGTAAGSENCLCRRYYPVPGQPVYRTSTSIAMHTLTATLKPVLATGFFSFEYPWGCVTVSEHDHGLEL
jgi:hypothetical protein